MGALFSSPATPAPAPPPPPPPAGAAAVPGPAAFTATGPAPAPPRPADADGPQQTVVNERRGDGSSLRPKGHVFDAEMDVAELDDRGRPGPAWAVRAKRLSRSHLVIRTRRMCYVGRTLLVAVHLVDDRPQPLAGRVVSCDYEADGQYSVDLDLVPVPKDPEVAGWYAAENR